MGRFEVTNDQFRRFRPDHHSGSYQGHTLNAGNQPVVNVSWEDARDYAAWMTKKSFGRFVYSLPSEAQWEYAARAGTSAPRFWGHDPGKACLYANAADLTLRRATGATAIHPCEDGHTATAPVGSFRPNPFGLYDMLGNVYEWTADVWSPEAYHRHTPRNPVYLGRGFERVYRGGGWNESPASVRCAFRFRAKQDLRNMPLGFRLIRKASY
jgi:formylglycine-generating enzyme required for sulfatase activity